MTASASPMLRDDELLIEREFDAPVALVYRLWESRDHMLRWWGPEKFTCIDLDWELTPGARWRAVMASKEYGRRVSRMGGAVREVERNKRIVFTFAWDADSGPPMDTVITVTFEEKDGKTIQRFHQVGLPDVATRDNHIGGWNSLLNKQQLYVENVAIADQKGLRT
ncbi:MAG TPA: SRPBCC domain-containing protein [Hyphomonadaceae bacterium]|nr:SRPBCC domain-containing protein [Hyphomonadaceae bacterium]